MFKIAAAIVAALGLGATATYVSVGGCEGGCPISRLINGSSPAPECCLPPADCCYPPQGCCEGEKIGTTAKRGCCQPGSDCCVPPQGCCEASKAKVENNNTATADANK